MERFDVILTGSLLGDTSLETAQEKFAQLFKIDAARTQSIFARVPYLLKTGTDEATALKYQATLKKIGLHCEVRPVTPAFASLELVATPDHHESKPEAAPVTPTEIHAPATPGEGGTFLYAVHKNEPKPETPKDAEPENTETGLRTAGFRFHGNGAEYFRIWIVNLLLTIVTFGIYSAWAKVRRLQYFYGNTEIEGSRFQYHGKPIAILRGRIIGLVFFGAYSAFANASPKAALLAAAMLLCGIPLMLWGTLRFRAANTSYRNLRFRFSGSLGEAYKVTVLGYLLSVFTLGLASPIAWRWYNNYAISNMNYGQAPFNHNAGNGDYYKTYFRFVLGFIGISFLIGILMPTLLRPLLASKSFLIPALLMIGTFSFFYAWWKVLNTNLIVNFTTLNGEPFESHYEIGSFFRLQLVNAIGLMLTLGFFWPWTQTRNAAYRAEHITLCIDGSLDSIRGAGVEDVSTIGEETGGFFDLDIGF